MVVQYRSKQGAGSVGDATSRRTCQQEFREALVALYGVKCKRRALNEKEQVGVLLFLGVG